MSEISQLHLIALMPGNRIRLNVARDFDWLHVESLASPLPKRCSALSCGGRKRIIILKKRHSRRQETTCGHNQATYMEHTTFR